MRRVPKVLLGLLALGLLVVLSIPAVTYYRDSATRTKLLHLVARELPSDAPTAVMAKFMQQHTTNSGLDEAAQLEYDGFIPQTAFDRFWGDRKVKLVLVVNRNTKTFEHAEVQIFYTGP